MMPLIIGMATYNRLRATTNTLRALSLALKDLPYLLYIVDQGSGHATQMFLLKNGSGIDIRWEANCFDHNIGVSKALNWCFAHRTEQANQHSIKLDNDFIIGDRQWIHKALSVVQADPSIGIVGVKWAGVEENPQHLDSAKRTVAMQIGGVQVEEWGDINSPALFISGECMDAVGGWVAPGLYGYEDFLYVHRARQAGFRTVYLPNCNAEHIDDDKDFAAFEEQQITENFDAFVAMLKYYNASKNAYWSPMDA